MSLGLIRAQRHAIGGYAAAFNQVSLRPGVREVVAPGAYARALADGGLYLLLNHLEAHASLASMADGTLHVAEDEYGLWVEASLSDDLAGARLMGQVSRREFSGMSTGSTRGACEIINGMRIITELALREISLVPWPDRPARVGTWVRANADARRERQRRRDGERLAER